MKIKEIPDLPNWTIILFGIIAIAIYVARSWGWL